MLNSPPPLQGPKKRTLTFISSVAVLFVLILLPVNYAWAKTYRVLILSSGNSAIYEKVINTIQSTVISRTAPPKTNINVEFNVVFLNNSPTTELLEREIKNQGLLLTIGQRAMIAATEISNRPSTIATLIPKQSYDKYRAALRKKNNKTTAIFIDNPPIRQILLAKILLGGVQTLGVLTGENSPYKKNKIKIDIQKQGIKSHIETVNEKDNLIRKLSSVLSDSDAFLALPDAKIFNRGTAKNILLTTYRHRTPVIAYSASYVKAGALAAVYSTPQQIAEQTAHILINILKDNFNFPRQDSYPEDFQISINKNVANSLDIPIANESKIKNKLMEILGRKK